MIVTVTLKEIKFIEIFLRLLKSSYIIVYILQGKKKSKCDHLNLHCIIFFQMNNLGHLHLGSKCLWDEA